MDILIADRTAPRSEWVNLLV